MNTDFVLDPRLLADSHAVATLELCDLRLHGDSSFPWLILIPRIVGARDLIDLDPSQQGRLYEEIDRCSRVLVQAFSPHKLNVAALGNVVEQLHVHVIARFRDDPAWPAPVWGRVSVAYAADAREARIAQLQELLGR
ncbi:MAG: HIT domain-containing protein [Gammaproteobacteria bacterium]|nr:MAG: HIT domain-containing protein [Gammaproteobacteria bacterium]